MTPQTLLTELHALGVTLIPEGSGLRYRAPKGVLTPELRKALAEQKAEILTVLSEPESAKDAKSAKSAKPELGILGTVDQNPRPRSGHKPDLTAGEVCAVLLRSAVLNGALVWLVAEDEALAEHPDIVRSGHPLFFFDEVEQLRGKTVDELRTIAMVKTVFQTGRVLH